MSRIAILAFCRMVRLSASRLFRNVACSFNVHLPLILVRLFEFLDKVQQLFVFACGNDETGALKTLAPHLGPGIDPAAHEFSEPPDWGAEFVRVAEVLAKQRMLFDPAELF